MKAELLTFLALPFLTSCAGKGDVSNLALYKTATASSSYDNNLTAQLLTDGIVTADEPVWFELLSSEGPVPKDERECTIDFDPNSRNKINVKSGWLEYRFHGMDFSADRAEVVRQEALRGGRGGERVRFSVPVQMIDSTGGARLDFEFPYSAGWRIQSVEFFKNGQSLGDLLPSNRFSSAWMSAGSSSEWVLVDLGRQCRINEIRPHWIWEPAAAAAEISRDGARWKRVPFSGLDARCRYVRILLDGGCAGDHRYCISEIEVMGRPVAGKAEGSVPEWEICRASDAGSDSLWLPASVPGTVLANFIRRGAVPDPGYGDNAAQISESYFASDFWYRHKFDYSRSREDEKVFIDFDGINWKADAYLNGQFIGHIDGAFKRGHFDVSSVIREGGNLLSVKVRYNDNPGAVKVKNKRWTGYNGGILGADSPTFLASIGWDWFTTVRGRNCGIWNDVRVRTQGDAGLADPLVMSEINPDGSADIKVAVLVRDFNSSEPLELEGRIGDISFSKSVSGNGEVTFGPDEFPQLAAQSMKLWWPNGYGDPYLYDASFVLRGTDGVCDSISWRAGIREVRTDCSDGTLKLYVNGRRINAMGGNWGFSQQNLDYSKRDYDIAVGYHRHMNMNMIRNWVGQIADTEFYDACDSLGIMVWQDFWLANPGDGPDPSDEAMFLDNAADLVSSVRRHPSIALYCGRNEGMPPASLDEALKDSITGVLHPDIPYLSESADGLVSGHGPYYALPDEYYFTHQSGKFHSERGLPSVTTYQSLCRMMPEEDRWPIGEMWGKHDFTEVGAQLTSTYTGMLEKAFGPIGSAQEYTAYAQWLNYNACRAIFESANSAGRMGILLWMTHSAWPSLVYDTYDYYFEPTGSYFGCRKACEPVHIQYNAATKYVEAVNNCCGSLDSLYAEVRVFGLRGNMSEAKTIPLRLEEDSLVECCKLDFPEDEQVCFYDLRLSDSKGNVISENLYIKGREDGNLQALLDLPAAKLAKSIMKSAPGHLELKIRNKSDVPAVMVRLVLEDMKGNEILPVEYSDNYFTIMPGETKTVHMDFQPGRNRVRVGTSLINDLR